MSDYLKEHAKEIERHQKDPRFSRPGWGKPEQRDEARRQREAVKETEDLDRPAPQPPRRGGTITR